MREAVVMEALSWVRTPYHHHARIKGVGVDCAQLLIGVYAGCGAIEAVDPGTYPPAWHLHQNEELFLGWLDKLADPAEGDPLPGDVVIYKFGRTFSHGAICVGWPMVVHAAQKAQQVCLDDGTQGLLGARPRKVYRIRGLQ